MNKYVFLFSFSSVLFFFLFCFLFRGISKLEWHATPHFGLFVYTFDRWLVHFHYHFINIAHQDNRLFILHDVSSWLWFACEGPYAFLDSSRRPERIHPGTQIYSILRVLDGRQNRISLSSFFENFSIHSILINGLYYFLFFFSFFEEK